MNEMDERIAALAGEVRRLRKVTLALFALLAGTLAVAFARRPVGRGEEFEEITVGRINVIEPDGTLRLVISNRSQFPGDFDRGTEHARPDRRDVAGMLFLNDEGTENGGFIQSGRLTSNGVDAGLSLTFDRFRQDQVLQLIHAEQGGATRTGVVVNDRPDPRRYPIGELKADVARLEALPPAEREAALEQLRAEGKLGASRGYFGTTRDGAAVLMLSDGKGRPRLMLSAPASGAPQLQLLDEQGQVTGTLAVTPVAPPVSPGR
ncbi:MAG: hypothetical protein JNL90_11170 [Planctomycetes bacterium]|nr:hypothetical protein [Planctomycetota bacterium]